MIALRMVIASGALALTACGAADPPPRPVPADADPPPAALGGLALAMSTETVAELRISGRDGRLDVRAAHGDSVRIRVELNGSRCDRTARGIDHSRRDRQLHVRVEPSTKEQCDEVWSVEIPARIALKARMDRADVRVLDLNGGVDIALGKGTLRADVQGGDLRLRVSNGDIIASSVATDYEAFEARAEVGNVTVTLDGKRIEHPRPAGPGDWLRLAGDGQWRIVLESTVGDVRFTAGDAPRRSPPRPSR